MDAALAKEGNTLGATLLITGCCIGAGMIGLPVMSATAGFLPSTLAMLLWGFLYYVSQKGTTGVRSRLADDFSAQMTRMRQYFQIPIVAGFGIADRSSAESALNCADGFVVGSAFVKKIEDKISPTELTKIAQLIDPRTRIKEGKND